jgi:DNA (cytosine-5)-methyltransferase 1
MKTHCYYNEFDPYAAAWLRELIARGLLPSGEVDERSITEVCSDDLKEFNECHFFAGIGGWPLALRLAGWPDDRAVWTGSCPCQPFSNAGKHGGFDDERHLWPTFYALIAERRPATIFGEQVASKAGLAWFDLVSADLESSHYAVGAGDLCAPCVGAPHVRQRLFFVADAFGQRLEVGSRLDCDVDEERKAAERGCASAGDFSDAASNRWPTEGKWPAPRYPNGLRELRCGNPQAHWHPEPGILRVADGVSARMGKLRAIGNALVPQVAAEFICASQGW